MAGEYALGYDVGTGGCKAVLATLDGVNVDSEFEPYEVSYPKEHFAEQDPADTHAFERRDLYADRLAHPRGQGARPNGGRPGRPALAASAGAHERAALAGAGSILPASRL